MQHDRTSQNEKIWNPKLTGEAQENPHLKIKTE